ncbi:MAG: sigma-70 family RNA polymerase sigma factor [Planctomycetes bacterium]|nr:sigma-70 family RNA polymerase sigma factor [Planctomycetota bacterium]
MDQGTWSDICVRYQGELLSRARREGVPSHDAEDIVQEVLQAARNYKRKGGAEVRTYLIAVLQNQVRKWIRKMSASRNTVAVDAMAESLPDGGRSPADIAAGAEIKELILNSFMELPDFCRNVCELRHVYGYSYDEISKELDVPLETVKSRLHRARKLLQEKLQDIL